MMSLIDNLQNPTLFEHPIDRFEVIETHISWVILTGDFVYKIKKPVNFGFLDFSTLEKRHFYCEEELRLNRRLAPELYLDVLAIRGSEQHPSFKSDEPVIEYAVKMKQFPQEAQLDRLLAAERLDIELFDKLADKVARFHSIIERVPVDSEFGNAEHIKQPVIENFQHIRSSMANLSNNNETIRHELLHKLTNLENWSNKQLVALTEDFKLRKSNGFVRECHGDMHLRNIAYWHNEILIFDCIEFNKNFYFIDVISEIAFLVMDLEDRGRLSFATRFLNQYLHKTGDYEGLKLLRFYKVYRAMVRAKVAALRLGQAQLDSPEYKKTYSEFQQYLALADQFIRPTAPCLLINHGLSGSGKSYCTRMLLEKYPALQLRSDIERKRLFSIDNNQDTRSEVGQGIYTTKASRQTYLRLVDIARILLAEGYSVVIDAANLNYDQRRLFIELAKSLYVPYFILDYQASAEVLRQRIFQRTEEGKDVSDATLGILEHQIENYVPLAKEEKPFTIEIDTEQKLDIDRIIKHIQNCAIKF
jgi:hypothetical protein